ncbi:VRR-NUC domain-containing protein [Anaerotignum sp.]|uniref:VRR-NUC domain-containing protein n=1 Tax=Anaerotignum sp. TaxID=2039241 RepID=UPI00331F7E57
MQEKEIEQYLVKRVKEMGGKAYKWVSPGNDGVPDRIVFFYGMTALVELKAPGKKPTPLQIAKHKELEKLGQRVFVLDSKEEVDQFIYSVWYEVEMGGGAYETKVKV